MEGELNSIVQKARTLDGRNRPEETTTGKETGTDGTHLGASRIEGYRRLKTKVGSISLERRQVLRAVSTNGRVEPEAHACGGCQPVAIARLVLILQAYN